MCGIVGVINGSTDYKAKLDDVFNDMLWADQVRGLDGAGVFWFNKKENNYNVVKNKDINKVLVAPAYTTARKWMGEIPFMIGHNRAATRGDVSTENNHPFDEGNVVLVHNGTMHHIPKEYDDGTKVDSHAIAKMLHKASVEDFMRKSFGAFALVWFNKATEQLNLLRNEDRPLHLIHFENIVLLSSESGLATWMGSRYGFKFVKAEALKPFHLYQFNPYNLEPTITDLTTAGKKLVSSYSSTLPVVRRSREFWGNYGADYEGVDEDDVEAYAHVLGLPRNIVAPPESRVVSINDAKKKAKLNGAKDFYESLNPYRYWYLINPQLKEQERAKIETPKQEGHKLILKLGEEIHFGVDRATARNKRGCHSLIFGAIPGNPIQAFEVRATSKADVDKVKNSNNYWKGIITALSPMNHGKTMLVEVSNAEESDMPNPDFALGVQEKN